MVDLDLPKEFRRLPREMEIAVFRVVQECLTNIHRHSGSLTAKIRLSQSDGEVLLEIVDKGKGISPEMRDRMLLNGMPGVGVRGMRERLRQLGGTIEISSIGTGTVVSARLPVAEQSLITDTLAIPDKSSSTTA